MDKVVVVVGASLLIGFIMWWFFGKRNTSEMEANMTSNDQQEVEVVVNGGYVPNTVVLKQGVPAKVVFNRKDPSGCFEQVVFPDFGISEHLPINEEFPIEIDTSKPGEYQYACGMNMFFGKVIVK